MSPESIPFHCLKQQRYQPEVVTRISFVPNISDSDLKFSSAVDPFEMDQNKILCSKSIRRLTDKTQVFFDINNPHVRNRLSHTHEVTATANTIGQSLGLNTELIKASALGHDLGHGPGGHMFEQVSHELGIEFFHERFSGIISTFIERNGSGLNLTKETINGILEHSRGSGELYHNNKSINENLVIMYSDKITSIFSDINDLRRFDLISESDYRLIDSYFPGTQRDRINQCIFALIRESATSGKVSFSDSNTAVKFRQVKDIMYSYYEKKLNRQALAETIKSVYNCIDHIPQLQKYDPPIVVALMTDEELKKLGAIADSRRVNFEDIKNFGVFELIETEFLEHQTYSDLDTRLQQQIDSN